MKFHSMTHKRYRSIIPLTLLLISQLLMSLVLPSYGAAQPQNPLRLEVTPSSGSVDDTFTFSVVIDGGQAVSFPYLVGGDDFKLSLIGPQTTVQIVNGTTRTQKAFTYRLVPKRAGNLKTPGAEVEVSGTKFKVDPLQVNITASSSPQFKSGEGPYFLSQYVDKTKAFVGEQLTATIDLYTSVRLEELRFNDLSFDGFWSENLGNNETLEKVIDGVRYNILRLRKAIFPLTSGKLTILPKELGAKAIEPRRRKRLDPFDIQNWDPFAANPFNDILGGAVFKDIEVKSNSVTIEVAPLPDPPANFASWDQANPIVGKTNLTATFNSDPINLGESKTVQVELSSFGNLSAIKQIPLDLGPSVKIYQESPETKILDSGGKIVTKKSFKLSLVPTSGGEFKVPGIRLGFFDLEDQQFKIVATQEIGFNVKGSPAAQQTIQQTADQASQTQPTVEGTQNQAGAAPYEEPGTIERLSKQISLSLALLTICGGILLAYILYLRSQRTVYQRPLTQCLKLIDSSKRMEDLDQAFRRFLSYKFGLDNPLPRSDQLSAAIAQHVDDPDLRFALQSVLDRFDASLYSGSASQRNDSIRLSSLKANVEQVLRSL